MKTIYFCRDKQSTTDERQSALEMAGYRVELFEDGSHLMRAMGRRAPDLVLLDVLVDGSNGFEVAASLELKQGAQPPVLLFSGIYTRPAFREEALSLGVTEYIDTGLDRDALLDRVYQALAQVDRRGAGGSSRAA